MKTLCLALFFVSAALASAADAPSIAGKWQIHSSISGNESDLSCTITPKDQEFTGACTSDQGDFTLTGKVEDKKVNFQFKTTYNGDELTVVYAGTFESAEKIVGTVDVQPMGVGGDFTATQAK